MPIHVRLREPGVAPSQLEETPLRRAAARRRARPDRRAARQVERERRRLGRELHTGVGQLLAAIRMRVDIPSGHLADPPEAVHQTVDRIGSLAAEALDGVRAVSCCLHPPDWHRLPLDRDPDPGVNTLLYRAAQEALANIVRHSHATRVDLKLTASASGKLLVRSGPGKTTLEVTVPLAA